MGYITDFLPVFFFSNFVEIAMVPYIIKFEIILKEMNGATTDECEKLFHSDFIQKLRKLANRAIPVGLHWLLRGQLASGIAFSSKVPGFKSHWGELWVFGSYFPK